MYDFSAKRTINVIQLFKTAQFSRPAKYRIFKKLKLQVTCDWLTKSITVGHKAIIINTLFFNKPNWVLRFEPFKSFNQRINIILSRQSEDRLPAIFPHCLFKLNPPIVRIQMPLTGRRPASISIPRDFDALNIDMRLRQGRECVWWEWEPSRSQAGAWIIEILKATVWILSPPSPTPLLSRHCKCSQQGLDRLE